MSVMRRVYVSGKVQNVGFRDWAIRRGQELRLRGWVRNLKDGRLEILVHGDDEAAGQFVDACREGPPLARVDHVEAVAAEERAPKGFTKRFTA
ncbi:MAG: acylphosphatase [Sphingomonas sp. 28-66-16]|nr:MAG: acylphosphatase [Sphingomonas sp. 28-66-16]